MKSGRLVLNGIVTAVVLLCCSGLSRSASVQIPQLVAARVDVAPVMDGKLDDAAWQKAKEVGGFTVLAFPQKPAAYPTYVKAVTDGLALYIGIRCVEPKVSQLPTKVDPRDGDTWLQESVEFIVDTVGERKDFYHIITNVSGDQFDSKMSVTSPEVFDEDTKWNGDWQVKTSKGANEWYAEIRIPLSTIDISVAKHPVLGINFNRARWIRPGEFTSWSPNRLAYPEVLNLGDLVIPNKSGGYSLVKFPALTSIAVGKQSIPIEVQNHYDEQIDPVINYQVEGPQPSKGELRLGAILPGEKVNPSIPLYIEKEGEYRIRLDAIDSNNGRTIYSLVRDVVATQPIAFDEQLYALYHKRADAKIDLRVPSEGGVLKASLLKEGSKTPIASESLTPKGDGPLSVSFDLSRQAAGVYRLTAQLIRNGQIVASSGSREYPYKPDPQIGFTRDGFLSIGGKPFFPVGIYSLENKQGNPDDSIMKDAKKAGFNLTVLYHTKPSDLMPMLDCCERNGIKALVYPTVPFSTRKGDETAESARRDLDIRRNHPAIIGWYVVDEPEGIGKAPVKPVRDMYQLIKEHDTDHPCMIVTMSGEAAMGYRSCTDVMWVDPYPVPKQAVTVVSDTVSAAVANLEKDKPLWSIQQAFDWSVWNTGKIDGIHRPTGDEQRNMTYLALVNGAKGIIYWAYTASKYYTPDYPEHWAELKKVAGEVHVLSPVLLTPTILGQLHTTSADGAIQTMVKKLDGVWYVLAVNSSREPQNASFNLSGMAKNGKLDVQFEGRSLELVNGSWKDSFKPLEVHVYKAAAK